jgi:hypothetical protein
MSNATSRHELRLALLANGYRPLPLLDKGIRIKGWTRQTIDAAWLEQYRRNGNFHNTGIRCDDLVAVDIDVLDVVHADKIDQLAEDVLGTSELCRIGKWPKRLLLYRWEGEPMPSFRSGKYTVNGEEARVELLTSPGRQFAAFGRHPAGSEYYWDGASPLETPWRDLPVITEAQRGQFIEAVESYLDQHGERVSPGGLLGMTGSSVYDLEPGTLCEVGGERSTWNQLRAELDHKGLFGNLQREDGELGDSGGVHFFVARGSGEPCAHDFPRDVTHWEAPTGHAVELPEHADSVFDPPELKQLLEGAVLMGDKTVRWLDEPTRVHPLDGFCVLRKHWTMPDPKKPNSTALVPVTKVWQDDDRALRADYAELRPDAPESDFVVEGPCTVLNTYLPPIHDADGGETDTALEFVDHLFRQSSDAELFLDWHALKVANPSWRMHGLIMVTPAYGTGRGTWEAIVRSLFGAAYVRTIQLSDLTGTGSQAQFNEFLSESLIVSVPEAYETRTDATKWASRNAAYERIKTICDPAEAMLRINRKYGRASTERVHASLIAASNHVDALAIEPGDRRLIVLDNTEVPLVDAPNDLQRRIHDWRRKPENITALHRYFMRRSSDAIARYDPTGMPPMTDAKELMIGAARSDYDVAFLWFVAGCEGDIVTPAQWRKAAHLAARECDLDLLTGTAHDRALTSVLRKHARRTGLKDKQIKLDGHPYRVWVVRNFDQWFHCEDTAYIANEVAKNGSASGELRLIRDDK